MLAATFVGFTACWEAGARRHWDEFRLDRLFEGRALLYSVGTPLVLFAAIMTARSRATSPARAASGIAIAVVATAVGIHGTVLANKDAIGLPFMMVATLLFVASTLFLSSRTNPSARSTSDDTGRAGRS